MSHPFRALACAALLATAAPSFADEAPVRFDDQFLAARGLALAGEREAACREELIVEADRGLVRERRRGGREQRGTSECPERMAHCRNPLRGATAETTSAGASSDCHDPSRVIWPQSLRALPLKNQRPSPIRRNTAVICR